MRSCLEELRPGSFAIAYRMLGSVSEAEDVVQEALLRVHRSLEAGERIDSPRAFVATVTTRLAIDELRSARVATGALRRGLAARADPDRRRGRPGTPRRDGGLAVAGDARAARKPVARAARGDPAAGRVRLRLRRDRRGSSARARTTCDSWPAGPGGTWSSAGRAFESSREQREELARRFFAAVQDGDLAGLEALLGARRGAHRRRWRQGAGAGAPAARSGSRGPGDPELDPDGGPHPGRVDARRRGQRDAGWAAARRRRSPDRRCGRSRSPAARSSA